MGGLAALARSDGHVVSGSDENVYPPMSTQLESLGIELGEGYDPAHIPGDVDLVIICAAAIRSSRRCSIPGFRTTRAPNGSPTTC